ncbi:MAG: zinc-binding dehydrogenase, partial [Phycisphaerales bacterium]
VRLGRPGERVTVPFVAGCGACPMCRSGNHQICDHQSQPGFTHWGSFAELVRIDYADVNLVPLPEEVDFVTAASLGCRFTTAFRALVDQGRAGPGEWVAVHGCGGVGLSAVMIARAIGAAVVAVDINPEALELARSVGAAATIDARRVEDVSAAVIAETQGGAHVSIDALGSTETCLNSIRCLRKQGRHVQVGLMVGRDSESPVPMGQVMSRELEIRGSHGLAAHEFPRLLRMITAGQLDPRHLVRRLVSLEEGAACLMGMDQPNAGLAGITVIDRF